MSVLTSVSGFPRIGQNRELKKIIEAYWKGVATLDDVRATAKELRAKHWKLQQEAGIDLIPSNDFSYYDQMLDTAILLNVIPQRYQRLAFDNPEETLFAMGRGYQGDKLVGVIPGRELGQRGGKLFGRPGVFRGKALYQLRDAVAHEVLVGLYWKSRPAVLSADPVGRVGQVVDGVQ